MKTFLLLSLALAYAGACQDGWMSHQGRCYLFSHDTENWGTAAYICQMMGAHLAEIEDADEDHYLASRVQNIGAPHWIGLTDLSEEGTYVWMVSGTTLTHESYTNWFSNQPDNGGGIENCVEYSIYQGYSRWNDAKCSNLKHYICEKSGTGDAIIG